MSTPRAGPQGTQHPRPVCVASQVQTSPAKKLCACPQLLGPLQSRVSVPSKYLLPASKKKKAITWGWSQVSIMSPVSCPGRPCDPCDSACSQALRPSAHSSDAALQRTSVLRASATERQAGARQPSLGGSHTSLPALTPTLAQGTVSRMRDADVP